MLRRVAVVGTDVSEDHITSIIRLTRIGELRTTLAVTSNQIMAASFSWKLLLMLFLGRWFL
jgi:hypothetical protein